MQRLRSSDTWILIALVGLSAAALTLSLPGLRFSPSLDLALPQNPAYQQALDREQVFPQSDPVLVVLNTDVAAPGAGPDSPEAEAAFTALNEEALALPGWRVFGPGQVRLPRAEGDLVVETPLWSPGAGLNPGPVRPSGPGPFDRLFWSPDRVLWKLYLQPEDPSAPDWAALEALAAAAPGRALTGQTWMDRWVLNAMARDLAWGVPVCAVLLVLVLWWLARRLDAALLLTLAGLMPALLSLVPFGWLGQPVTFGTLVAPFLVLALSTTYSLHLWHHVSHHGPDLAALWRHRGRPLAWAGATTLLGFFTLVLSPVAELRWLGAASLTGLGAVFAWTLVGLPRLLTLLPKGAEPTPPDPGPALEPSPRPPFQRAAAWARRLGLGLVLVGAVLAWPRLGLGIHWADLFWPGAPQALALAWLEAHGDVAEPYMAVAEGPEGYWWTPEAYGALHRFRTLGPGRSLALLDYTPLLDAVWRGWEDRPLTEALSPGDSSLLAELSTLVPQGRDFPALLDPQGSQALLSVFQNPPPGQAAQLWLDGLSRDLETALPGTEITWIGPRARRLLSEQAYAEGQFWGLGVYFVILAAAVALAGWHHRRLFWVPLAPLGAVSFLLGLMALLGWRVSPALSLVLAGVAGVSADDALLWAFLGPLATVRRTVIQTTALLILLLIPLALSSFFTLVQVALLTAAALVFSTLMVLWFLPWKSSHPSA